MSDPIAEWEAEMEAAVAAREANGQCGSGAGNMACELSLGHVGPHEAWRGDTLRYRWGASYADIEQVSDE